MNKIDFTKVYGHIGKVLCGCAGGIIGFVIGGPLPVIPGIVLGVIVGHFLEKFTRDLSLKTK